MDYKQENLIIYNETISYIDSQHSPYQNNNVTSRDEHEDPSNFKPCKRKYNSQYNTPAKIIKHDNFPSLEEIADENEEKNTYQMYRATDDLGPQESLNYALTTEKSRFIFNEELVDNDEKVLKKKFILEDFVSQVFKNNTFEETNLSQYKFHIEHAFSCPKMSGGQECLIQKCSNPQEIVTFVNNCLEKEYDAKNNEGEQKTINMVHFVVIWHSVTCSQPNICSMPLCCKVEQIASKLIPDCVKEVHFKILFSIDDVKETYVKGTDFDIPFNMQLGKGAFGNVTYSLFTNKYGSKSSVIIKEINLVNTPQVSDSLSRSLPALRKLTNCPNVLVPNLILHGDGRVLMFMEKGEISLFDLMIYRNEMSVEEVTFYMSQIIDGISQIHKCGLTHCDVKVSNCVLTDRGKVLKIIDLDTLKKEDEIGPAGTPGYVSPDVLKTRLVRQKDDVYSAISCIPVLLSGTEKVLHENTQEQILKMVWEKDEHLAAVYAMGTQPFENRFTSSAFQKWFRESEELRKRVDSFQPSLPSHNVRLGEYFEEAIFRKFFESTLDSMQRRSEPVETCDYSVVQ